MVTYMAMRVIYGAYVVVGALIFYRAISMMLFHPEYRDFFRFIKQLLFGLVWPLSLFTRNGRNWLRKSLPFVGN